MEIWLLLSTLFLVAKTENFTLIQQTRSGFLEKYKNYANIALMHFEIPEDASEAQFKLRGTDLSYSIFGCSSQKVVVLLKYGSPPVANPDGSKFPEDFYLNSTSEVYHMEFVSSNTDFHYINLSSPFPGTYYAIAFFPYTNPKDDRLTQQGLTLGCEVFIDANLYAKEHKNLEIVTNDLERTAHIYSNDSENVIYKISIPVNIDRIRIVIKDVQFCETCTNLIIRVQSYNIPSYVNNTFIFNMTLKGYDKKDLYARFDVLDDVRYFIKYDFEDNGEISDTLGKLIFSVKYLSSVPNYNDHNNIMAQVVNKNVNKSDIIPHRYYCLKKSYKYNTTFKHMVYYEYKMHKSMSSDSFLFTYDMKKREDGTVPMAVNLTNEDFSVLRFSVYDKSDVGGLLQFIFAFKPIIKKVGAFKRIIPEPENNTVVICVHNFQKEIPTWPSHCVYHEKIHVSPLILNSTHKNVSMSIPFPEAGVWFVTIKLFCGTCEPCNCPTKCLNDYKACRESCEISCWSEGTCHGCATECENNIISKDGCEDCDCDGNCKNDKNATCKSTVIFDVSSYPCVNEACGRNGKCAYMVHEGFVFSTCVCFNNYKGWDCSDDSNANPFEFILTELLLLVLSNLVFLPAVYVAYRRAYYIEAIVYFSTCFSSTFYHACDAGENILSFCIMKLEVLQFADFYCASLSIWFTLMAMANLKQPISHIVHVFGAILIACFTHSNKQSVWIFLFPVIFGLFVIGIMWGRQIYRTKKLYPEKRYWKIYLPCGILLVTIGITLFTMFQTKNNYLYVHSVWHIIMATAVVILLPVKTTFETIAV